jgi:hypothetical protein
VEEFRQWAKQNKIEVKVSGVKPEVVDEVLDNYKKNGPEWVKRKLGNDGHKTSEILKMDFLAWKDPYQSYSLLSQKGPRLKLSLGEWKLS